MSASPDPPGPTARAARPSAPEAPPPTPRTVPPADAGWLRARLARRNRDDQHRIVPPGPTAFVLGGGGSRGAIQVGMLAELVDRGIRADRVYGASVGAVNGAAYCNDPTPQGIERLEEVWRHVSGEEVFPRSRVHGLLRFLQHRPSVHPNTGLRHIVEDGVDFELLEEAQIPLEVVATSLIDGGEHWLTRGPVVDAVLASAAIPALLPPVSLDGDRLIDGGVVNNVPISRPLAAGARRIYVLLCGPRSFHPPPAQRPVEAVLTAFFIAVHARFARELATVGPDVEVVVFSAEGDASADYRDFSASAELIEAGRVAVASVLDGAAEPALAPTAP